MALDRRKGPRANGKGFGRKGVDEETPSQRRGSQEYIDGLRLDERVESSVTTRVGWGVGGASCQRGPLAVKKGPWTDGWGPGQNVQSHSVGLLCNLTSKPTTCLVINQVKCNEQTNQLGNQSEVIKQVKNLEILPL